MLWKCPACHAKIRHNPLEAKPRPPASYRCHVCLLDLVFDAATDQMTVAPMRDDDNQKLRPSSQQSDDTA